MTWAREDADIRISNGPETAFTDASLAAAARSTSSVRAARYGPAIITTRWGNSYRARNSLIAAAISATWVSRAK